MSTIKNILLENTNKTPLDKSILKTKFDIKDNILTFKVTKINRIIYYILRFVVWMFWLGVIYNICTLNFLIGDKAPLIISILFTFGAMILGIFFTFYSLYAKALFNTKEFIDLNTGKVNLINNDEKYEVKNIIGLQLICYSKKMRFSSAGSSGGVTYYVLMYEINLVFDDEERLNLISYQEDKQTATINAEKISDFLKVPLVSYFEAYNKKQQELKKEKIEAEIDDGIDKQIKTSLIYSSEILTNIKKIEALKKMPYEINQISENEFSVSIVDQSLNYFNLPKEFKYINAFVTVYETNNPEIKKVSIKTGFRFDVLFTIIIMFFMILNLSTKNDLIFMLLMLMLIILFFRTWHLKSDVSQLIKEIVINLNTKEE